MKGRRLALVGCPLIAILLYLPALGHDFVFDDRGVILQNPLLGSVSDLPRLLAAPYWNSPGHGRTLYRPLTSLSFALDRILAGGPRPGWFHLVNVLLHGLSTFLVTLLAFEVLPGTAAPAVAGLLFAVHPVHVEAVAGIVGRAEILAACGVVAAVLAHRRALRAAGPAAARHFTAVSWIATLLAMLGKESAAVTPLLCALADVALSTSPTPSRSRRGWLYGGQIAALGMALLARGLVLGTLGVGAPIPFVDNPAASAGPVDGRLTALACLPRYAALLLWPARLSADYSFDQIPLVRSILDPWAGGGLLLLVLVIAGGAWALRAAPPAGFALLWIVISASLTTNLVVFIGTLLAERLMYLPSIGICLLAGVGLAWAGGRGGARVAIAFSMALCVVAAARAWARIPDWKDDFSLYRSAARVSPRSARIRYNLGNAYLSRQDYELAGENYRAALAIYPDYNDARVNLGMALAEAGRPSEAIGPLSTAAARDPRSADLAVNLGAAYRALGDLQRAEVEFRRALGLDAGSARAWNNLGSIALARGDLKEAVADMQEAVRQDPDEAIYHVNLADALTAAGREGEADEQFEETYRLSPDLPEARRGRGEAALRRGDRETAEREFRAAASGRPPSARAANFLGYLLAQRGDPRGAAEQYERAVRIDPGLADAHRSLGLIYAQKMGETAKGARELEISLTIDPNQPGAENLRRLIRSLRRRRGPA